MRKREFNNRMSLRGEQESSTWKSQQNKIVGRDPHVGFSILLRMTILKIGRSLEFFVLQKIGGTLHAVILGQQRVTRVSKDIKWTLGSSPRVTEEERPRWQSEEVSEDDGRRREPMGDGREKETADDFYFMDTRVEHEYDRCRKGGVCTYTRLCCLRVYRDILPKWVQ